MSDERGESIPYILCSVLLFIPGVLTAAIAIVGTVACLAQQNFQAGIVQPIAFLYVVATLLILGGIACHRKATSY